MKKTDSEYKPDLIAVKGRKRFYGKPLQLGVEPPKNGDTARKRK